MRFSRVGPLASMLNNKGLGRGMESERADRKSAIGMFALRG